MLPDPLKPDPLKPAFEPQHLGRLLSASDGWQDIHLIFHRLIHTISGQTGAVLTTTTYDVAARDEPGSPPWFHSGRTSGTHSSFTGAGGRLRNLIVGGSPVGAFTDVN